MAGISCRKGGSTGVHEGRDGEPPALVVVEHGPCRLSKTGPVLLDHGVILADARGPAMAGFALNLHKRHALT